MKLYHIYNIKTFEVTALLSENKPLNFINHVANGEIKPIYDLENDCVIEGATQDEINFYNKENELELKKLKYNELLKTDWYFVRLAETGQEVPAEILEERKLIRNR
jgi:hypothetical protein